MSNLSVYGINFTEPTLLIGLCVIGGFIALMFVIFIIKLCRLGVKKLSFDTNGGNKLKSLKFRKGKKVLLEGLPNPEKDGDTFIEWCDNITLSTKLVSFIMPNAHKTVYAKWQSDIDKENARKEAEKRRSVKKSNVENTSFETMNKPLFGQTQQQTRQTQDAQAVEQNVVRNEEVKPTQTVEPKVEQPTQAKPVQTVKPKVEQATQVKPAQTVKPKVEQPTQARPTQTVKPKVAQSTQSKPSQAKNEEYQYQFKEKTDVKSTYAYSKYNQEYQERLEKIDAENRKLDNYEKLSLISSELHFSIDSLKVLDSQNIDILYRKALKSKSDRERYVHTKEQQVQAAYRKHNEYSNNPRPEGVAGLGGGQSAKSYYNKPTQETKTLNESPVKPVQNVVKEEKPVNEYSQYEQMFGNVVADEVVEEEVSNQNVMEPKDESIVKIQKNESEVPSVDDLKSNKEEKLDELNKNIDKLNSELEIIKNLLLKNMK